MLPTESGLQGPGLVPRENVGELSTELESSPEWLLLPPESDFLESVPGQFRPETDPDELELLLVVVAGGRVKGDTGEPRSSSLKSGLLVVSVILSSWSQLTDFRNRSVSESNPNPRLCFPECDISEMPDSLYFTLYSCCFSLSRFFFWYGD